MRNLKEETLYILEKHGKTPEDVRWVGCEEFAIPLQEFWVLAHKSYDSGYGAQEVAPDLMVVGDDWWLERHEYDGSEWWEYKATPKKPDTTRKVTAVIGDFWNGLETYVVKEANQ